MIVVREYEQKGNLEKALLELNKSPHLSMAIIHKADIVNFLGDHKTAQSLIDTLDPEKLTSSEYLGFSVVRTLIKLSKNDILQVEKLNSATRKLLKGKSKQFIKENYWVGRYFRSEGDYLNVKLEFKNSINSYEKSIKIFENTEDKHEISRSIHKIGMVLENQGKLEKALEQYIKSLEISRSIKNKYNMANSLNRIGVIYAKISDLTKATEFLDQSRKYSDEVGFRLESAKTSVNLGVIHKLKGDLNSAEKEYQRALKVFRDLNDFESIGATYINLGLIHYNKGDLITAKETYEEALPLVEKYGTKKEQSFLFNNLGIAHKKLGNYNSSLNYHKKSLKLKEETGDKGTIAPALLNIGVVHLDKGELNLATTNIEKALQLWKEIGNVTEEATSYQYLGLINIEKGEFEISIQNLKRCLQLRRELNNEILISETLYHLIVVSIEAHNHDQAFKYFEELKSIDYKQNNKVIKTRKRLAQAILLQSDSRINKKVEAQELFEEVLSEELIDNDLTIFAMLKLCEFLLLELKVSGEKEVLVEIKTLLEKLYTMAQEQESHTLLIEILIIQSQLALVEYNVKETKEFLEHANEIAEDKELTQHKLKISYLMDQVEKDVIKFANIASSVPINDRINQLQIESYLKEVADHKDLNSFDPEMFKTGLKKNLQMHLNFANLLLMDKTLPEEMKKYVHFIDLSSKEIQFSISTLLMIEKLETGTYYQNLEDFNCDEIIQYRINHYEEKLNEKSLVVDFQKTNGITTVRSDQYLFSRIMDHLLDNAIKFADEKSTIKIILETDDNSRTITIQNDCEAIPKHEQSNLFDKYTQYLVHESTRKHGVGLGLSFCDLAIKSINGKVSLTSPRPNKDTGVSVTIVIPKEIL